MQPDQHQRWLKASDRSVESRGGADPCSVAANLFLFLFTVTSSLPSSRFLITLCCPMAGEVGTRSSLKSLSTQTILGFCDSRAVSELSQKAKKNIYTVEAR